MAAGQGVGRACLFLREITEHALHALRADFLDFLRVAALLELCAFGL